MAAKEGDMRLFMVVFLVIAAGACDGGGNNGLDGDCWDGDYRCELPGDAFDFPSMRIEVCVDGEWTRSVNCSKFNGTCRDGYCQPDEDLHWDEECAIGGPIVGDDMFTSDECCKHAWKDADAKLYLCEVLPKSYCGQLYCDED